MKGGRMPNVLMVMVDALRPDHLGCGGNSSVRTPNIDRLASSGAFFENTFCPMPSSAPSRASIFTGRFPHAHGVRVNGPPLPSKEITLAQILSEAGYLTGATPKFSSGFERGFSEIGVERSLGLPVLDRAAREEKGFMDVSGPDEGPSEEESRYHTTIVTDATIEWLRKHRDDRWFFWLDYHHPHEPWHAPEPYGSLYDPDYEGPDVSCPSMYEPGMGERERRHAVALYDGEVALVDKNIGRVMITLEKLGLWDKTLVVLLSDHGVFLGEHNFFKKPPFLYDPLIRSTLMLSWPGRIRSGTRIRSLSHINDVMPTVLDLLRFSVPDACQGVSLVPLLNGNETEVHEAVFIEFCEFKGTAAKAVRTQEWKYIYYRSVGDIPWAGDYAPGYVFREAGLEKEMLFYLPGDPSEQRNLTHRYPGVVQDMRSLLIDWMIDTEDKVPGN